MPPTHASSPTRLTRSDVRVGILLGIAVLVCKAPLLFWTLGEQDQGRLMIDALVYASQGADSERVYGVMTSPAWTLLFAGLAKVAGHAALIPTANILGWICGGLSVVLSCWLLRLLGASLGWAASGAVVAAFVPGVFYMSLYGYPSQFGLPMLLGSSVAFACGLESSSHSARLKWMTLSAAAYCLLTLLKTDFAVMGTLLFAVAIVRQQLKNPLTLSLLLFPILAAGVLWLVTTLVLNDTGLTGFMGGWRQSYPGGQLLSLFFDPGNLTVINACGWGTVGLAAMTILIGIFRASQRSMMLRILAAWILSSWPLWLFWMQRHLVASHPMSTRHALPGCLVTALFASLSAAMLFQQRRWTWIAWPFVVVGLNWPFGVPNYEFNYLPSGNLAAGVRMNRDAFAIGEEIGRRIAMQEAETIIILGGWADRDVRAEILDGIDLVPSISIALASESTEVVIADKHPLQVYFPTPQGLSFLRKDGSTTDFLPYVSVYRLNDFPLSQKTLYYTLRPLRSWEREQLNAQEVEVVEIDPRVLLEKNDSELGDD